MSKTSRTEEENMQKIERQLEIIINHIESLEMMIEDEKHRIRDDQLESFIEELEVSREEKEQLEKQLEEEES